MLGSLEVKNLFGVDEYATHLDVFKLNELEEMKVFYHQFVFSIHLNYWIGYGIVFHKNQIEGVRHNQILPYTPKPFHKYVSAFFNTNLLKRQHGHSTTSNGSTPQLSQNNVSTSKGQPQWR